MQDNKFSIGKRARSFRYAFEGIKTFIRQEHNARIHCCVLFFVVLAGSLLRISRMEWVAIVVVCGIVLMAEAFNTALEKLADHVCMEHHPAIKQTKDIAAAAVLITAVAAAIVGLIIFIPRLILLFS